MASLKLKRIKFFVNKLYEVINVTCNTCNIVHLHVSRDLRAIFK